MPLQSQVVEAWWSLPAEKPSFQVVISQMSFEPSVQEALKGKLTYEGFRIDKRIAPASLARVCHHLATCSEFGTYAEQLKEMGRCLVPDRLKGPAPGGSTGGSTGGAGAADLQRVRNRYDYACSLLEPVQEQSLWSDLWTCLVHAYRYIWASRTPEEEALLSKDKKQM